MIDFDLVLTYIRDFIAAIGVLVILCGALRSLLHLWQLVFKDNMTMNYIRLEFGNSITLGLEFMVGADIIGSLVKPDYYNLGLLAILVVVRIVLSYFLNLELSELTPQQKHAIK